MASTLDRVFSLPPFSELRVVTSTNPKDRTRVLLHMPVRDAGDDEELTSAVVYRADIFGSELVPGVVAQLPAARSVSIFTPTGCTLTVTAPPTVLQRCYATTSGAVWMRSLLSLHSHLEVQRVEAKMSGIDAGPRVLVVSDQRHVGTSTYARMLSAFAVRLGYHPLLVDGDVDHPRLGYPGCLGLYHLQYTLDVEEEAQFLPGVHVYAGGNRCKAHEGLYLHGVQELMKLGLKKMGTNDRCRVGGLFFDYGVVSSSDIEAAEQEEEEMRRGDAGARQMHSASDITNPLDLLLDTIVEGAIDHVFVVQSGWLRYKIAQRAYERFASGGAQSQSQAESLHQHMLTAPTDVLCEEQGVAFKLFLVDGLDYVNGFPSSLLRRQRWMHYFFGTPTSAVKPTLVRLETSAVYIASVGSSQHSALAAALPMMDEATSEEERGGRHRDGGRGTGARKVDPAAVSFVDTQDVNLKRRIVGISSATKLEELPDGSCREVPYTELERKVQECVLVGFACVESVGPAEITLLVNDAILRKDLGICLVLMDEYLTT